MNKTERNETTEESLRPVPSPTRLASSGLLWRESPTSLTRDRAPSHRIPKAERFCSTKLDLLKYQQLETLHEERQQFGSTGVSFARSTRPEHFAKHAATPSPASYRLSRLMDGSIPRAQTERSLSSASSRGIRGATMSQFYNYHKSYLPQAKHLPYQPECTLGNPSPAHYAPNCTLKGKHPQHSFKHALRRFREADR